MRQTNHNIVKFDDEGGFERETDLPVGTLWDVSIAAAHEHQTGKGVHRAINACEVARATHLSHKMVEVVADLQRQKPNAGC